MYILCCELRVSSNLSLSLSPSLSSNHTHHNHSNHLWVEEMRKVYWFVIALQILSWISATSRPFPPNAGLGVHQPGTGESPESLQATLQEGSKSIHGGVGKMNAIANYREFSKIGSSPPSCDHKCYGCTPCEAIQVPTTKKQTAHLRVQYANYEPEGWKCKCGPTYYTP